MASSTAALAASLDRVASRLRTRLAGDSDPGAVTAFTGDLEDDPPDVAPTTDDNAPPADTEGGTELERASAREELALVEDFARRARALPHDGKADSLVKAVRLVMARPEDRRKVVIFTESLTTQDYLRRLLLEQTELVDADITLFRGVNDSARALGALGVWREEVEPDIAPHLRPSTTVAVRLALVHEFRTRSVVLISSEAGAKGLNLQFCDTVVNYDLPWNPQRIEQRIGRCHRYGQKRDVTVINFLAKDNEAQRLTFDILSTKLDLFGKVNWSRRWARTSRPRCGASGTCGRGRRRRSKTSCAGCATPWRNAGRSSSAYGGGRSGSSRRASTNPSATSFGVSNPTCRRRWPNSMESSNAC